MEGSTYCHCALCDAPIKYGAVMYELRYRMLSCVLCEDCVADAETYAPDCPDCDDEDE